MMNSPLQLKGYFLKEIHFSISEDFASPPVTKPELKSLGLKVEAETSIYGETPRQWRCELAVESSPPPLTSYPYQFRIVYIGFFEVDEHYPEDKVELLAKTNAPALLYSGARELLLMLTSRAPFLAPLFLPSVTFIEPQTRKELPEQSRIKRSRKKS